MEAPHVNALPAASASAFRDTSNWRLAGIVARFLVGGLFMATSIGKINDPLAFAAEIQDYEMAPVAITHAMAIILPWVEGSAGLMLILTLWRREARLMIAALLVIFTIAKAYAYFGLGQSGACGCGGNVVVLNALLNNPQGLITNLVLLGLVWLDAIAERFCRDAPPPRGFAIATDDAASGSADPAN